MSNEQHSNVQEERSQGEVMDALSMADLRTLAKVLGITSQRDWTKEDYVKAIQAKNSKHGTEVVVDESLGLKPGHARVMIHRDPTPGHGNKPVHVGFNGKLYAIPRGLTVEVPKPVIESLKNAVTTYTEQDKEPSRDNPGGTFRDSARVSYPYQVLAEDPRPWAGQDPRSRSYAERKAFYDRYGAWPTEGELKEAKKARINRDITSD